MDPSRDSATEAFAMRLLASACQDRPPRGALEREVARIETPMRAKLSRRRKLTKLALVAAAIGFVFAAAFVARHAIGSSTVANLRPAARMMRTTIDAGAHIP